MTKLVTAFLTLALFLPVTAFAQQSSGTDTPKQAQQQEANQAAGASVTGTDIAPNHMMRGTVGDHGRTFTSDNTVWTVSNPHALKNYDNQEVSVRFQFNPDDNTIRINKVESGK